MMNMDKVIIEVERLNSVHMDCLVLSLDGYHNIIIINHRYPSDYPLRSPSKARMGVIPCVEIIILDEMHQLHSSNNGRAVSP